MMSPNVHALDRPLRMGDPEQIAAIKALEAGERACDECGTLWTFDETDWHYRCGRDELCPECIDSHLCESCGDFIPNLNDLALGDGMCAFCLEQELDPKPQIAAETQRTQR